GCCWPPGKAERRYAGVTHINVGQLDDAKAKEIKTTLAKYGLEISSLAYYPNPLTPDAGQRKEAIGHLKKVISANSPIPIPAIITIAIWVGVESGNICVTSQALTMDTMAPTDISIPPPIITMVCPAANSIKGKNTRRLLFSTLNSNKFGWKEKLIAIIKIKRNRANI
ncbi:unnamed protein product, partial [marine sediment metagenome]